MQLFELGSVTHKQYLVNIVLPYLPLSNHDHFRGIAPISKLSLYVSHALSTNWGGSFNLFLIAGDSSDYWFYRAVVYSQVCPLPCLLGNHMLVAVAIGGKTLPCQPH